MTLEPPWASFRIPGDKAVRIRKDGRERTHREAFIGTNDPPLQFETSNGNYTILEPPVFLKFVFQTRGLRACNVKLYSSII